MWKFVFVIVFCEFVKGQTDFIPTNYEEVTRPTMGSFGAVERCGEGKGKELFTCVPYYKCDPETNRTIPDNPDTNENKFMDYSLLIDIRIGSVNPCSETLQVCCEDFNGQQSSSQIPPIPTTTDTVTDPSPPKPILSNCGIRNNNGIDFKITGNMNNEAEYGEFPWMVAILKTNYNPAIDPSLAICGGSLIAPKVILTGAHCVHKYQPNDINVRAGEWDTQTQNERYPYQERDVDQIIIHKEFKDGVLLNDVALLVLKKSFSKARHIGTICIPDQNEIINSKECYATGWGKTLFSREGEYQVILKKIDLPMVPHQRCEEELKKTRLGNHFRLHSSFTCAGGVEGKDTCTGDGGSPLVCPDPKNPTRYVQAGIVAWGIGCGTTTPGVYADVSKFRNWIDEQMRRLNLSDKTYTI